MTLFRAGVLGCIVLIGVSVSTGEDTFSRWETVSGESNVQYRWKSDGQHCDLELQNPDVNDRSHYEGIVDYVWKGKDDSRRLFGIYFDEQSNRLRPVIASYCERVSSVTLHKK